MSGSILLGGLGEMLGLAQGMAGGALPMLLSQLENAGLAERVQSWLGHGENLPVTPAELGTAFTPEQVDVWAQHAGTTPDAVLQAMSEHLPAAVARIAPAREG